MILYCLQVSCFFEQSEQKVLHPRIIIMIRMMAKFADKAGVLSWATETF